MKGCPRAVLSKRKKSKKSLIKTTLSKSATPSKWALEKIPDSDVCMCPGYRCLGLLPPKGFTKCQMTTYESGKLQRCCRANRLRPRNHQKSPTCICLLIMCSGDLPRTALERTRAGQTHCRWSLCIVQETQGV